MSSRFIFSHDINEEFRLIRLENDKLNSKLNKQHDKNSHLMIENQRISEKYTTLKQQLKEFRPMMVKYKKEKEAEIF